MFDGARKEISSRLIRPLDDYYPIVCIDTTVIPIRWVDHVTKEAYYTVLGVRSDCTRKVLGEALISLLQEARSGFLYLSNCELVEFIKIDLVVSDALTAIKDAVWKVYGNFEVQLCTIHLLRNYMKEVKPKHKKELANDFNDVFRTDNRRDSKQGVG